MKVDGKNKKNIPDWKQQLDLELGRTPEPDRNHEMGGRSFYFFDIDDNIFSLNTPIFIFNKDTSEEVPLGTGKKIRRQLLSSD